ncbi:MAG: polyphosphate kinase 1 [Candidatus Aureabacteria bacterium]|nr:polyphosphate kinase 1 [Candidatus Auribacterota bacterium]
MKQKKSKFPEFINRELSWIEFNQRVLDEAFDISVPLSERLNFLCITCSNLDEFIMVRVGGLWMLMSEKNKIPDASGYPPSVLYEAVTGRIRQMIASQYHCFLDQIEPELRRNGIKRIAPQDWTEEQHQFLRIYFENDIYPALTPVRIGQKEVFPLLSNLELHLAIRLKPPRKSRIPRYAVLPLGRMMDRIIRLPSNAGCRFVLLEDLLKYFLARFFEGEEIMESALFRITRNADLAVHEDKSDDLLEKMTEILDARKHSECIRLEVESSSSPLLLSFLKKSLKIKTSVIYRIPGPLYLADFQSLIQPGEHESLHYEPWPPQISAEFESNTSVFDLIKKQNRLFLHPYESFEPVLRLIAEAAADPNVLTIKQILYRTSRNSPVVAALQQAAEAGKNVTVIVELKARFDEARNIAWAKKLEKAGAQVIYGVKGLKVHAKACLIVRREPKGIVRYMHFGTGNYNEITAKVYSDVSFMTCAEDFGYDLSILFNMLTGYSQPGNFLKLAAAPFKLRKKILELIETESQRKREGKNAMIMIKINSLVDTEIIRALYRASIAGVKILLNVRGVCCLRPGIKHLSENITVVSIVDRFLEHSRIFYFYQNGHEKLYLSSADWMPRNFDRRVELLIPVDDPDSRKKLMAVLEDYFQDTEKAKYLQPDGTYALCSLKGATRNRSQEKIYRRICHHVHKSRIIPKTVLEPHLPLDNL